MSSGRRNWAKKNLCFVSSFQNRGLTLIYGITLIFKIPFLDKILTYKTYVTIDYKP